ncbi:LEA type 2 family protein [Pseudomonas sp. N040]|uniref:LEA type 2 family protein n=1 Tax=Pseudomonas sp. N040 TaxID=2785325 RepID=UPI001E5FB1EF|nr:LEA type 2 family protein [Pseudomonas sp. N040]
MHLVVLSLVFCLPACSSLFSEDFHDPSIHLVRVEVVRAKMLEQKFNLYFRVENPNEFSLDIDDLSYSVFLNDIPLASGQRSISVTLPADSTTEFKVPVRANLWRNLKQVIKMLKNPNEPIRYRLEGTVEAGSWFGRTVHLSRSGEIIPGNFIPE